MVKLRASGLVPIAEHGGHEILRARIARSRVLLTDSGPGYSPSSYRSSRLRQAEGASARHSLPLSCGLRSAFAEAKARGVLTRVAASRAGMNGGGISRSELHRITAEELRTLLRKIACDVPHPSEGSVVLATRMRNLLNIRRSLERPDFRLADSDSPWRPLTGSRTRRRRWSRPLQPLVSRYRQVQ